MSNNIDIRFRSTEDSYVDLEMIPLIDEIVGLVQRNANWSRDPRDFIFRSLKSNPLRPPPPYLNVNDFYRSKIFGKSIVCTREETALCEAIQELFNLCLIPQRVDKVIGSIFEKYIFATEKSDSGGRVYCNANVYINNSKIKDDKVRTVDFVTDHIKQNSNLELCECTISLTNFKREEKQKQLQFYAKVFDEIRKVKGGDKIKMKFELLAGYSNGYHWGLINIPELESLRKNNVSITRRCVFEPAVSEEL